MGYSMGYADVDALLAELLAGVRGTLGPQLVAVYLDGSLATGEETRSVGVVERGLSSSHPVQHVAPRSPVRFGERQQDRQPDRARDPRTQQSTHRRQSEALWPDLVEHSGPRQEQQDAAKAWRMRLGRACKLIDLARSVGHRSGMPSWVTT